MPSSPHASDFDLPWCAKITSDPSAHERAISFVRGTPTPLDLSRRNTLIGHTLATPSTLRATRTFTRRTTNGAGESVPECVMLMSLGSGMNGYPDTLHGGMNATLLDTLLGSAVVLRDNSGDYMTRTLTVVYDRPVRTPAVVLGRAWCERLEGRKMFMKGCLEDGEGRVLTSAEGLWVRLKGEGDGVGPESVLPKL